MKIFFAADHRGFEIKNDIVKYLKNTGYDVQDASGDRLDIDDDFPVIASRAIHELLASNESDSRAILVCGSGQGMVMAANRHKGIRAGLGWSRKAVKDIRNDEDSNVLALPAELYEENKQLVLNMIEDFIKTPFAGASRYIRRNHELDQL